MKQYKSIFLLFSIFFFSNSLYAQQSSFSQEIFVTGLSVPTAS